MKVHSRLWRETALLRATGGSVLEGISSEVAENYNILNRTVSAKRKLWCALK
jgi:hypothetical protein